MEELHKAIQLMEEHKTKEAIQTLTSYLPHADEEERFTIVELYIQWGMLDEAKPVLEDLIQRYPNEAELKLMMADLHIDLDEDDQAIELLNQFTQEDEDYLQVLVQLADLYQAQGLFEVAEQKLLEAKRLEPNSPIIDFALGELAFSNGEYAKSVPYYENAMHHEPVIGDIEVAARLAEAYAANGEFEEALAYFGKVEEEHADILFRYGIVAFQANRLDIAIKVWENLLDKDPYFVSAYSHLAQAYEAEGLKKEAINMAKEGLRKDEFNKELFYLAGSLSLKQGNKDEAYQYMEEAVALDPGYKEAVLFLIKHYKEDEYYQGVIQLIEQLKELGEEDPHYFWELAEAYEQEENYKEAAVHFDIAYPLLKADTDFLKKYGHFLVEEGNRKKAVQIFQEYLMIEPSDTETEEFLRRLTEE